MTWKTAPYTKTKTDIVKTEPKKTKRYGRYKHHRKGGRHYGEYYDYPYYYDYPLWDYLDYYYDPYYFYNDPYYYDSPVINTYPIVTPSNIVDVDLDDNVVVEESEQEAEAEEEQEIVQAEPISNEGFAMSLNNNMTLFFVVLLFVLVYLITRRKN
jgi:hypothetical protein